MYRTVISLLLLCVSGFAQNHLEVIYPKDGQQIPAVDSTFILGNTDPQAKLTINGYDISIHKDGGFLAFLPVSQGQFCFDVISNLNNDYAFTTVNLVIGSLPDTSSCFIDRSSVKPSGRTALRGDDIFEFAIDARPGGKAFCGFVNDSVWTPMYPDIKPWRTANVFGDISASSHGDFITYVGYLPVSNIIDSSIVYFLYESEFHDADGQTLFSEFEEDSTDFYVIRINELPPRTVRLVGRPRIIRTEPGKGYKLVNQPAGVRFECAGETPDYYRLQLADNVTGYVRKTDSVLEPEGTPLPKADISFIAVDDFDKYVTVSMFIDDMLPYEIHTDGNLMTIDIFGLTSDTDWIRFNGTQKYIKSIWWEQPQADIYRLNIRWYDKRFRGYSCNYENDKLILKLKKRLRASNKRLAPLDGLRIFIDPGHSHDSGAVGPTGLQEKNANLWIAHELRQILIDKGAEVLMTRMGHENLGLYDRVDIARKWEADLLISIHNNALPDGINPFVNNGTSAYYYFDQARPLAESIRKRMVKATGLPDHGLYYGNLALTRVTDCPAVLIECAFMMIPEQEAKLKTDKFQRQCARAIYKGILDYLRD